MSMGLRLKGGRSYKFIVVSLHKKKKICQLIQNLDP